MAKRIIQSRLLLGSVLAVLALIPNPQVFAGSLNVTWNSIQDNRLAGYKIHYGSSTGSYTQTVDTGLSTSFILPNLSNGSTYYMVVAAYDSNRVEGFPSPEVTGTVLMAFNGTATSITSNSAVITWQTNKASDSQVEFGTTTAYGSSTALDSTMTSSHSKTLTGLSPSTTYQYRVRSQDAGSSVAYSVNGTFTTSAAPIDPFAPTPVVAINSGGTASAPYRADANVTGGSTAQYSCSVDTSAVSSPAPMAVYQSERAGEFIYSIPNLTAGTNYTVRLHFAENYWTSSGKRLFNVTINGTRVLSDFDILAAAGGRNKAIVKSFSTAANSQGRIVIQFSLGSLDRPKVSGIEVLLTAYPLVTAINAGGMAASAFKTDCSFSGGNAASYTSTVDTSAVANPAPLAVYQAERWGNFTYTLPNLTSGTNYIVRLHFAENYWTSTGKRLFHVTINGTRVLTDFDIVAAAGGPNKAIVKSFSTAANSQGRIIIQFSQGSKDWSKVNGIEALLAPNPIVTAINSGGSLTGAFKADSYFRGGVVANYTTAVDTTAVTNPAPQAVYQSERFCNFTYTIPNLTPGANYTVRLHFAENYWTSSGKRLFHVSINGTRVLSDFDIAAAAGGPNKAIVKSFSTAANSQGQIVIQFLQGPKDFAKVSGIEITR